MNSTDIKIFEIIDLIKAMGYIDYDSQFCESIGMLKQNLGPIKRGTAHFTAKQIKKICDVYGVNANFIFSFSKVAFEPSRMPVATNEQVSQ